MLQSRLGFQSEAKQICRHFCLLKQFENIIEEMHNARKSNRQICREENHKNRGEDSP